MNELDALWRERSRDYWSMALRYWRLIGNSGLVFTLYILLIAGGYYYHQWLQMLPDHFPTPLVLTMIFSIFTIRSPIRTFLQRPDIVFLLPLESKLDSYFRKSLRYSFLLQCVTITIMLVVLSPLYLERINASPSALILSFLLICGLKWWNIQTSWYEKYISDEKTMRAYTLLRGILSVIFLYLIFKQVQLLVLVTLVVLMFLLFVFFYRPLEKKFTLKWERLVSMDEQMLLLFLKLANLFTDVPRLRDRVKPRTWLNFFLTLLPYKKQAVFKHFFVKTFFRANDYFGIYVRLIIIGGIVIYFVDSPYAKSIFVLLFMYITGLQLLTLWKHELPQGLGQLYPLSDTVKQKNFIQVLGILFIIQSCIYSVISFVNGAWIILPLSLLFTGLFSFGIVKKRIQRTQ